MITNKLTFKSFIDTSMSVINIYGTPVPLSTGPSAIDFNPTNGYPFISGLEEIVPIEVQSAHNMHFLYTQYFTDNSSNAANILFRNYRIIIVRAIFYRY